VIEDIKSGSGRVAIENKIIKVHYTGWLYDPNTPDGRGVRIDTSLERGEPWSFVLGSGKVIKGWDEGLKNMKVGGKRKLLIPPDMAYGKHGAGTAVPPNSALVFEVELLDVSN